MDGWMDSHGNSEKQKYATVHGLTVDGATTLETNPTCLPLTSQSEKSKKERCQISFFSPHLMLKWIRIFTQANTTP